METVLIVDDDKDLQFNISSLLRDEGYETIAVGEGRQAIKEVKTRPTNLVLLDIKLPGMDGMNILEEMKSIDKDLMIIMLTAYGDVKQAVKAMKLGAFDYLAKPFDNEELLLVIKKAFQTQYLCKEVEILRKKLGEKESIEEIMGQSPQIKRVLKQAEIVAPTNLTVIIQGESGTGKELIANLIHQKSLRKAQPFIPIDCGAIPETLMESELFGYEKGAFTGADNLKEGKFEQANTGTLFLDEITNLSDGMQAKLLRVIQERKLQHLGGKKDIKIDVRLLVASKINLAEATRQGSFRDDLFHRLNEFLIELPKLCERKEDVPILAKYFLEEANSEFNKEVKGFSPEAMKFFLEFSWPGNVRELKNVARRAALLAESDTIEFGNLSLNQTMPTSETIYPVRNSVDADKKTKISNGVNPMKPPDKGVSFEEITQEFQKDLIKRALDATGGNKIKAAKTLKIDRKTLYRKMKSLGL